MRPVRLETVTLRSGVKHSTTALPNQDDEKELFILYRPPDKSVKLKMIFHIIQPNHMLWVLKEMVLLSIQNICRN